MAESERVFLKWGGSLITAKRRPYTARPQRLRALAQALQQARVARPGLQVVLGHGSGSFGHTAALAYREHRPHQGLVEVRCAAARLHARVMAALAEAGVPALSFPPAAFLTAQNGVVEHAFLVPMTMALLRGYVPVLYGDAVLDRTQGWSILSTEALFAALVPWLRPRRLLLAGEEAGVWRDFPRRRTLFPRITPEMWPEVERHLSGSQAPDVTGGMRAKVRAMLHLVEQWDVEVWIFDGRDPQRVIRALLGEPIEGTCLCREVS